MKVPFKSKNPFEQTFEGKVDLDEEMNFTAAIPLWFMVMEAGGYHKGCNNNYLDSRSVVKAGYTLHQVRSRMIAEITADVANSKSTSSCLCIMRMVVRLFVQ